MHLELGTVIEIGFETVLEPQYNCFLKLEPLNCFQVGIRFEFYIMQLKLDLGPVDFKFDPFASLLSPLCLRFDPN